MIKINIKVKCYRWREYMYKIIRWPKDHFPMLPCRVCVNVVLALAIVATSSYTP
jgi:hypothetical protein